MTTVYVITNPELGWDCVIGVLTDAPNEDQRKLIEKNEWVLHKQTAKTAADLLEEFEQ